MSVYDRVIADLSAPNSSDTLVAKLIGTGKTVLDVGCASGYLSKAIADRGNEVSGFELDAGDAAIAAKRLKKVVVGDLQTEKLSDAYPNDQFDVVLFADVLEHINNPKAVLEDARQLLRTGGSVVISIPNVAHGSLRLALLNGQWNYTPTGLLDETHIRFYTLSTLVDLLADSGYDVTECWATQVNPFESEVKVEQGSLPAEVVEWLLGQAESYYYQYILRATPSANPSRALPAVNTPFVLPAPPARLIEYTPRDTEFKVGDRLESPNGQFALALMQDGNVNLLAGSRPVRSSHTPGRNHRLFFQSDGNLVLYGPDGPITASHTANMGERLMLSDQGLLSIQDSNGRVVWTTDLEGGFLHRV